MRRTAAYFFLRAGNSFLVLVWGFVVTYVFIRVLGISEYSLYVVTTALAIYLSAADLGVSNILYAHVHAAFLKGEQRTHAPLILSAVAVYAFLALAGTAIFSISALLWLNPGTTGLTPKCLYFLFSALNLPWLLVRSINWAIESHFFFEAIDFLRRIAQIALVVTLLLGFNFSLVMIGLDTIWALAFFWPLRFSSPARLAAGPLKSWPPFPVIARNFFALYGKDIRAAMGFSGLEFFLYNFPYAFIPFVYGPGAPLVMFDVFYKFLRGGVVANQALSSGFLQPQTRAFHEGRGRDLLGWSLLILGGSLSVSITAAAAILLGGDGFFKFLLNKAVDLGPQLLWAIAIALIANSIQNTAGSLVVYTGHVRFGVRLAAVVAVAMAVYALIAARSGMAVQDFILGYACMYALGALLWAGLASQFMVRRTKLAPT